MWGCVSQDNSLKSFLHLVGPRAQTPAVRSTPSTVTCWAFASSPFFAYVQPVVYLSRKFNTLVWYSYNYISYVYDVLGFLL